MKHVRLALVGAVALALVACDSAKKENTPVPEELPVNKEAAAPAPAPAPADTAKKDTVVEEKVFSKKKAVAKKPTESTNVQKKENRDVPTTAAPTNVQKRPSRE